MKADDGRLIVKFSQEELQSIGAGEDVLVEVVGQFTGGQWFCGAGTVHVIDPGFGPEGKK